MIFGKTKISKYRLLLYFEALFFQILRICKTVHLAQIFEVMACGFGYIP